MAEPSRMVWTKTGAWAGVAAPGRIGAPGATGVALRLVEGIGLASLIAPAADRPGLAPFLAERLGLSLSDEPVAIAGRAAEAIWSGPDQWLLRLPVRDGVPALLAALAPLCAASDQSDARAVVQVSGPRAREALAKGVMIDLHPKAFAEGAVALTSVAHIGLQLRRLADDASGARFEILVPRSYGASFWSWLAGSAAEFGVAVETGRG